MTKIYVVESARCRDCGEVVGARYDYKERVVWIDNESVRLSEYLPERRCKTCEAINALRHMDDEDDE